jgi:hypothetical protein
MKEEKLFISYKQLIACIIILTITFQTVVFLISYKTFFSDTLVLVRLFIIATFLYFYGAGVIKGRINDTVLHALGLVILYFLSLFVVEFLVKYFYPDLLNNFIQYRVEESLRSSVDELGPKGYQIDASASMKYIEASVMEELSNKRSLIYMGFKMLFSIPFCYGFAFLKKPQMVKKNHNK